MVVSIWNLTGISAPLPVKFQSECKSKSESRDFETSRDLALRRLTASWIEALGGFWATRSQSIIACTIACEIICPQYNALRNSDILADLKHAANQWTAKALNSLSLWRIKLCYFFLLVIHFPHKYEISLIQGKAFVQYLFDDLITNIGQWEKNQRVFTANPGTHLWYYTR